MGEEAGWASELVWMLWRRGNLALPRDGTVAVQPIAEPTKFS
jgi:hypothetical protein